LYLLAPVTGLRLIFPKKKSIGVPTGANRTAPIPQNGLDYEDEHGKKQGLKKTFT